MDGLEALPVRGIGDVTAGDDLAGMITSAAPWLRDGDVLVVTSKIVSKAEGQLVDVPTGGGGGGGARGGGRGPPRRRFGPPRPRARWPAAGIHASCRPTTASSWRAPASMPPMWTVRNWCCYRRILTPRPADCAPRCRTGSAWTSPSSFPTR